MSNLSKIAEKCRSCPFLGDCNRKCMEAYGVINTLPISVINSKYQTDSLSTLEYMQNRASDLMCIENLKSPTKDIAKLLYDEFGRYGYGRRHK